MTSSGATKELVQKWLAVGIASSEGLAMVADEFVWRWPPSMAEIFENSDASQRGREGLARLEYLDRALYANYQAGETATNVHFLIAEDDVAVMEFDAAFTTHEGEQYHNEYCLVVRVAGDKIAEVREHADTLYSHRVCMGTPEKRAAVLDRLARLRSGEDL